MRDQGKNPVIFAVPVLGEKVYSFRVRLLEKLGIETRNLGVIASGKPIYCLRSPFTIKHVEYIVIYSKESTLFQGKYHDGCKY